MALDPTTLSLKKLVANSTQNIKPIDTDASSRIFKEMIETYGFAVQSSLSPAARTYLYEIAEIDLQKLELPIKQEVSEQIVFMSDTAVKHLKSAIRLDKAGSNLINQAAQVLLGEFINILKATLKGPIEIAQIDNLFQTDDTFHETVDQVYTEIYSLQDISRKLVEDMHSKTEQTPVKDLEAVNFSPKNLFNLTPASPTDKETKSTSKLKTLILILQALLRKKEFDLILASKKDALHIKAKINLIGSQLKALKAKLKLM